MARRKSGRSIHGWLVLDKPAGPSSAAMVAKAKWAFAAQKAGHAGTLDPAATGVLAIALGEATKTAAWATGQDKTYRFTIRWGAATTTDDAEGAILATSALRPDPDAIRAALPAFTGDILQTPPNVSAVHVDGRRAYDLVRAGETPELAARTLHVARLELISADQPDVAILEMTCGKGGYVRAIARDLGAALGCLGHVGELRRLRAGAFDIADALDVATIEALARSEALDDRLLPVAAGLAGLTEIPVDAAAAAALAHGMEAPVVAPDAAEAWASLDGRPAAIGAVAAGAFRPTRVFVFD